MCTRGNRRSAQRQRFISLAFAFAGVLQAHAAAPPSIDSFSPTRGPSGTDVVISGSRFTGVTNVAFNAARAGFIVDSSSQIRAVVPVNATSGPISVRSPDGTALSSTSFLVPPTISGFSPTNGAPGEAVTITGANFDGVLEVRFNGINGFISNATATQIIALVPNNALSGPISVVTAAGTAFSSNRFAVAPRIASFSPRSSFAGQPVLIRGFNFDGATNVLFGGVPGLISNVFSTQIVARVPPEGRTGPIAVSTPAGTAATTSNFIVNVASVPVTVRVAGDLDWQTLGVGYHPFELETNTAVSVLRSGVYFFNGEMACRRVYNFATEPNFHSYKVSGFVEHSEVPGWVVPSAPERRIGEGWSVRWEGGFYAIVKPLKRLVSLTGGANAIGLRANGYQELFNQHHARYHEAALQGTLFWRQLFIWSGRAGGNNWHGRSGDETNWQDQDGNTVEPPGTAGNELVAILAPGPTGVVLDQQPAVIGGLLAAGEITVRQQLTLGRESISSTVESMVLEGPNARVMANTPLILSGESRWKEGVLATSPTSHVANTGTLIIEGGAGTSRTFAGRLENYGRVEQGAGELAEADLTLDEGEIKNTGVWRIGRGKIGMPFPAGNRFINIDGGVLEKVGSESAELEGLFQNTQNGQVTIESGRIDLASTAVLVNDGTFWMKAGFLRIDGVLFNGGQARLGGIIDGSGVLTNKGNLVIQAGDAPRLRGGLLLVNDAGRLTVTNSALAPVSIPQFLLLNTGRVTLAAGQLILGAQGPGLRHIGGGEIEIARGGELTLQGYHGFEGHYYARGAGRLSVREGTPALHLVALELNQSVQDAEHSIPLISNKTSILRAHVYLVATNTHPIFVDGALLRGYSGGNELAHSPAAEWRDRPSESFLARRYAVSVRGWYTNSLNFLIPTNWTQVETLDVRFEWTNGLVFLPEWSQRSGNATNGVLRASFVPAAIPEVKFVMVQWTDTNGTTHSGNHQTATYLANTVKTMFPISDIAYSSVTCPWPFTHFSVSNLSLILEWLNAIRSQDDCGSTCKRLYYGVTTGPFYVNSGGLAESVEGNVAAGYFTEPYPDLFGSYSYAPHELGHLLGQDHAVHSSNGTNAGGRFWVGAAKPLIRLIGSIGHSCTSARVKLGRRWDP